jgi:hypothetical protein
MSKWVAVVERKFYLDLGLEGHSFFDVKLKVMGLGGGKRKYFSGGYGNGDCVWGPSRE